MISRRRLMMAQKSIVSGPGYVYFATEYGVYRNLDPTDARGWSCVYGGNYDILCNYIKFGPNGIGICTDKFHILRSADGGETWTAVRTNPNTSIWNLYLALATNGSGLWICTANNGDIVYSTDDGLTWTATASKIFSDTSYYSPAYGNGKFVVLQRSSKNMATSSDGINWTAFTKANFSVYNSMGNFLTFYDGKFYSMTSDSVPEASEDGLTWTTYSAPSDVASAICVGKFGDTYIIPGKRDAGGTIWTSSDLSSWTVAAGSSVSGLCVGVLDDMAITGDTYGYYNIFQNGVWTTYISSTELGNINCIAKW